MRSCYRQLHGENARPDRAFWNKLWKLKLLGNVVNYLWRACRNCSPTAAILVKKHVNISTVCTWCHAYMEDGSKSILMQLVYQGQLILELVVLLGIKEVTYYELNVLHLKEVYNSEAEAISVRESLSWIKALRSTKRMFKCDAKL